MTGDFMPLMLRTRLREPELIGPKNIPMDLLLPHQERARRTHGQTLRRLKERGGLDPIEALGIIEDWSPYEEGNQNRETRQGALDKLAELVELDRKANL